ncbi:MAG: RNB domain-containing ribonuclease [Candidatus Obscuribacterales bacterium]|jgi:exoribonuclease-2
MPKKNTSDFDLVARADKEVLAAGFTPVFPPETLAEVANQSIEDILASNSSIQDLRGLLWSSIDNRESQDLDQVEYAERLEGGKIRLIIGIADVDSFVPKASAIDLHAQQNATTVYTGIVTYPMLPEELSYDLTSLLPDQDRLAMCTDLTIDEDGKVLKNTAYQAVIRNKAKLDYNSVANWFTSGNDPAKFGQIAGLEEQLEIQGEAKEHIQALRQSGGALALHTQEARTVAKDGHVLDLELVESNQARDLIENCMIAANIATSKFLEAKSFPSIMRTVKNPDRWPRIVEVAEDYGTTLPQEPDAKALAAFLRRQKEADPDEFSELSLTIVKLLGRGEYVVKVPGEYAPGHFALAVNEYTHSTAPNRRYPDLITQRLLKAVLAGEPSPYSTDELSEIAANCSKMESQAKKVERTMRKISAAVLLSSRIGDIFDGIITGVKADATYVRTFRPPVEGKLLDGNLRDGKLRAGKHRLDVGDRVKVRLVSTDPENAYIDFAFVSRR